MKEPVRLRDSGGAARALLDAGRLEVPHASRQRALVFTGVAAGLATTGTAAAAGATSLVKSVVVCVCLGTLGGGLASLAASETISRWQAPAPVDSTPAASQPRPARGGAGPAAAVVSPTSELAVVPAPPVVAAGPEERAELPAHPSASAPAIEPPATATTNSSRKTPSSNLFEEQRIIESARAAVSRGDAQGALSTLDGYARSHGQGQFGPEALALRIEALRARGDLTRARSLAAEFRQRYPHHPLLASVQAAVQGPPTTPR